MGISNVGPFLILADHFKFSLRKVGQENDSTSCARFQEATPWTTLERWKEQHSTVLINAVAISRVEFIPTSNTSF